MCFIVMWEKRHFSRSEVPSKRQKRNELDTFERKTTQSAVCWTQYELMIHIIEDWNK